LGKATEKLRYRRTKIQLGRMRLNRAISASFSICFSLSPFARLLQSPSTSLNRNPSAV